jgi:hypothetical protein
MPSFSMGEEKPRPPASTGTRNAVMPRMPASGSVMANTTIASDSLALLVKVLPPDSVQPSGPAVARVLIPLTSEPASGSVRAKATRKDPAASPGRHRSRCSGEPNWRRASIPR